MKKQKKFLHRNTCFVVSNAVQNKGICFLLILSCLSTAIYTWPWSKYFIGTQSSNLRNSKFNDVIMHSEHPENKIWLANRLDSNVPASLHRYAHWHASMRHCMNSSTCDQGAPKILLWRCRNGNPVPCNGLGDRFRGIQLALVLAIVTKRLLLLDWPDKLHTQAEAIVPSAIDWRMPKNLNFRDWPVLYHPRYDRRYLKWERCPNSMRCLDNPKFSEIENSIAKEGKILRKMPVEEFDFIKLFEKVSDIVIHSTASDVHYLTRNQHASSIIMDLQPSVLNELSLERFLLNALITPGKTVLEAMKALIPQSARHQGYIAIHGRTGYDFKERETSRGRFFGLRQDEDRIAARFLRCAITIGLKPGEGIFIASDSTKLKREFSKLCRERKIDAFFSSSLAMHIGRAKGTPSELSNSEAYESYINVFAEFFSISKARLIISNGSYFSRMAFSFGNVSVLKVMNATSTKEKCF